MVSEDIQIVTKSEAALGSIRADRGQVEQILMNSDVVMPEMSGPAAVSKLRLSHPEVRVLYVSGYAETPIVQELIAEGAVLLQKPLSRMTLLTKVDELLHSRAGT